MIQAGAAVGGAALERGRRVPAFFGNLHFKTPRSAGRTG
jgi:hypothetical protein